MYEVSESFFFFCSSRHDIRPISLQPLPSTSVLINHTGICRHKPTEIFLVCIVVVVLCIVVVVLCVLLLVVLCVLFLAV